MRRTSQNLTFFITNWNKIARALATAKTFFRNENNETKKKQVLLGANKLNKF